MCSCVSSHLISLGPNFLFCEMDWGGELGKFISKVPASSNKQFSLLLRQCLAQDGKYNQHTCQYSLILGQWQT